MPSRDTVKRAELIDRIWERDPTLWTGADEAKWLGWLDEPQRMRERVAEIVAGLVTTSEAEQLVFDLIDRALGASNLEETSGVALDT